MEDSDLEWLRSQRREQLRKQKKAVALWKQMGHGEIVESAGEVEFFGMSKSNPKVFVQFYKKDLNVDRCQYLTKRMKSLASKYMDILFVTADVERHPFLVSRLSIVVIPTIIFIKEMRIIHGILGFSDLNNSDDWGDADLEKLMNEHKMFEEYSPDWKENFAADSDANHELFN